MKITIDEQKVLKKIHYNEGFGTQFSTLLVSTGFTRPGLQRILTSLKGKGFVIEKYRHSRCYLYIVDKYRKKHG